MNLFRRFAQIKKFLLVLLFIFSISILNAQSELEQPKRTEQIHLNTNTLGWAMLMSNIGIEVGLSENWSLTLPVYYSALDYFSHTVKFRTFMVQPEFRYWFSENDGFFTGAHFGLAYYNIAWDGDYRIQDKNRNRPALGGGISVGYRLPISADNRWKIEFSIGAGAYDIHYDKFHNKKNGLLIETVEGTYFGIDQMAISFSYMFDVKKGKR